MKYQILTTVTELKKIIESANVESNSYTILRLNINKNMGTRRKDKQTFNLFAHNNKTVIKV